MEMSEEQGKAKCGEISDFIQGMLDSIPEQDRAEAAKYMIVEAAFHGTTGMYEAMGLLEMSKPEIVDWYNRCSSTGYENCGKECNPNLN